MTLPAVLLVSLALIFCGGVFFLARRIIRGAEREKE